MYIKNYQLKGLNVYDPTRAIINVAKSNGVIITAAYDAERPLAFHVYVTDKENARSWISTSCFRNTDDSDFKRKIGRANKRLRYEDMLYFKNHGRKAYDWGGVSSFENPNGIDKLKMSFGGVPITYYNETIICSQRYKIFYTIKHLLKSRITKR